MKSMWEEHNGEDEREIYGEMLMETFSIAVSELKLYHACLNLVSHFRKTIYFSGTSQLFMLSICFNDAIL